MKRLFRTPLGFVLALLVDLLVWGGPHRTPDPSPADLAEAMAVQDRFTDDLFALDGVVGTAVGIDRRGGAVVKVYLTAGAAARLPATLAEVRVVPEITGRFVSLGDLPVAGDELPGAAAADDIDPKRGFPRPVPIGVSSGHGNVTAGTIGARVTDGSRIFALSNNHVFAGSNAGRAGDNVLQPGVADGGSDPDDAFGTLHDYEPIGFCTGGLFCPSNRLDAAIALTSADDLGTETPDGGYGSPRSATAEASIGMRVQKYGRTTGHTRGRVSGLNATINVSYRNGTARFVDQIVISGDGFSAGGDSGSLIVTDGVLLNDRRPVGLLFAGSANSTIANPIDLVLDRFDVTVDGS